jgi:ELWxxDGT repeat protein
MRVSPSALILVLASTLAASHAFAQPVYRVRDINTAGPADFASSPDSMVAAGSGVVFLGSDPANGREPWTSDGTAAGTFLLRDIAPGPGSSEMRNTIVADGVAYFVSGLEIWRSDGTIAGTFRFVDLPQFVQPIRLARSGSTLFFSAWHLGTGADTGIELWKSDGTRAGTTIVRDIVPGPGSSDPRELTAVGGVLFFSAYDPVASDIRLWRTDGSEANTVPLGVGGQTPFVPRELTPVGSTVFFTATDLTAGRELWRSDGTDPGTQRIADLEPGIEGSSPEELTAVGTRLFFIGATSAHGRELWKSDGTPGGTSLVADLVAGPDGVEPRDLTAVGNRVFYSGVFVQVGRELMTSDGTAAGTTVLPIDVSGSHPINLTSFGGLLYFTATTFASGTELWKSDGTPAGTVLVSDLRPGGASSFPHELTASSAGLFFGAYYLSGSQVVLWRTSGTAATTVAVDPPGPELYSSFPEPLGEAGDVLAFAVRLASLPLSGSSLWLSDGTEGGTAPTAPDCAPCVVSGQPWAALGALRYFPGFDDAHGRELWVTDGTAGGAHLVADLTPGPASSEILSLTTVGDRVFVGARIGFGPYSLWTVTPSQPATFVANVLAYPAVAFKGRLFFQGGLDLWTSDGTAAGTIPLTALHVPWTTLMPTPTTLYFVNHDLVNGGELWKTDGTVAGTRVVLDICPGLCSSFPTSVAPVDPPSMSAVIGETLYFVPDDGTHGSELWRTDGTPAGTTIVSDILAGVMSSGPSGLVALNGRVLFTADDGTSGRELWRSDGTPVGTVRVSDLVPGPGSGALFPRLHRAGGEVFFAAHRVSDGLELWKSDGTGPGTLLVHDIAPGPASSSPDEFAVAGPRLFFAANDGTTGTELWAVDVGASLSAHGTTVTEGNAGTIPATFEVRLTGGLTQPATMNYATVGGSAMSGVDFVPTAGTLTFTPGGAVSILVQATVNGDLAQEPDESFRLQLFGATGGVAIDVDSADAVIMDDDGPTLAIADQVVLEGNSGTVNADFTVTLRTADAGLTASPTLVGYEAREVTALEPQDFDALSGTITFPAGTPDGTVNTFAIPVRGDTTDEPDESFVVDLTPMSAASLSDGSGRGLIRDDDGSPGADLNGLTHGGVVAADLASHPGRGPDVDWYLVPSDAPSSYELIVDEVSGDVQPLTVELLLPGEFQPQAQGTPVGLGGALSLRWFQAEPDQKVRVRSGGCLVDCGTDDTYRIRAYDTSYAIPRYNSTGGQLSLVIVQNRTDQAVTVTVRFWSETAEMVGSTQQALNPHGSTVISAPAGTRGSVTVVHNGGYGALAGKSVSIEQATGFSFDAPMQPRPR